MVESPSLYEYYKSCGVRSGLTCEGRQFKLNNREFWLYSGAVHYFRVPKPYWRDRLRKLRAAGLNTVETYVPWNLHEYEKGKFDFGDGGSDMEDFLDIKQFLEIAQEEDLLAIVRPGPYICAEWDFGGLPSWLLREEGIKLRTNDPAYMKYVERYFNKLLPILCEMQYTHGGPIIAFQIENEYGSSSEDTVDTSYLYELEKLFQKNRLVELYFTSDNRLSEHPIWGDLPDVLRTINFQVNPEEQLDALVRSQPDKPVVCMEYWTGWFDHWGEKHHVRSADKFADVLERILKYPASVNLYMFHGGTNWGFLNGGNIEDGSTDNKGYKPDTTSYDYDAPLSENGDYTNKYKKLKEIILKYNNVRTKLPEEPKQIERYCYKPVKITGQLTLSDLEEQSFNKLLNCKMVSMEMLPINDDSGQSYGYIVYKRDNLSIPAGGLLKIAGRVCDTVMVLVNGRLISKPLINGSDLDEFGCWKLKDSTIILSDEPLRDATLELVVENWGRANFGSLSQFNQFKGLWQGPVTVDGVAVDYWDIYPLEFKRKWINCLKNWASPMGCGGLGVYKGALDVSESYDTYIDMRGWCKGIVIINGFVLGRYSEIGPQMALYLPAPLLRTGLNEIIIFEHFRPGAFIKFSKDPIYKGCTSTI